LVDDNLEKIIIKSLAIEKSNRYQDAVQFLSDLRLWNKSGTSVEDKNRLTDKSDLKHNRSSEVAQKVREAFKTAYDEGDLERASRMLAQALRMAPDLRDRYETQLKLWQSGKIM